MKFWWNFTSQTQTLENVARKISPKFHAKFHATFGREKREKNFTSALLQGSCSSQNYYRQSCYYWEFISPKLPLPLPSWNSDEFWRVSNAALGDAALVLSSKNWKNIQDGGQRRKINPKSLGSRFSLCYRAGIDAAISFLQVHPPPKIKSNKKFKTLRWCLLRWRLTLSENLFNFHYRYRLGVRSHPFISIGSQLPSWKSFELISSNYRYRYRLERFLNWKGNNFEYDS